MTSSSQLIDLIDRLGQCARQAVRRVALQSTLHPHDLGHQTLSQLDQRMIGALGNIQAQIVFAVDRNDAESVARNLLSVDGERIKHVVTDGDQQERSHPIFHTLQGEWEKCVQEIHDLPPRTALIKTQSGEYGKSAKSRCMTEDTRRTN